MKIKNIKILNIRNHNETQIELSQHINVFYGLNGAGKTSILEAVAIGAFSRSFQNGEDGSLIKNDEENSFVRIDSISELEVPYFVSVANSKKTKKNIKNSYGDNLIPKDIIGKLPIVVLSPDLKAITAGSPADRRKFINQILSQTSLMYSESILKHRRCLKQRNKLISQFKTTGSINKDQFDVLTNMFIELNSDIISRRMKFIDEFSPYFTNSYNQISLGREEIEIRYEPDSIKINKNIEIDEIKRTLYEKSQRIYESELRRGTTLFGSQKDEIQFIINGTSVKETASQGQHKTILISLKFAEFRFIKENLKETPVILLDDIFSELDSDRAQQVVDFINQNQAQSFITITNPARLESFDSDEKNKYFYVKDGKIE